MHIFAQKKPASAKKKKTPACNDTAGTGPRRVNKHKPGKLLKSGRPQKDQIWIWDALQNDLNTHFVEAKFSSIPRMLGTASLEDRIEMLSDLHSLSSKKGEIFVSDFCKRPPRLP